MSSVIERPWNWFDSAKLFLRDNTHPSTQSPPPSPRRPSSGTKRHRDMWINLLNLLFLGNLWPQLSRSFSTHASAYNIDISWMNVGWRGTHSKKKKSSTAPQLTAVLTGRSGVHVYHCLRDVLLVSRASFVLKRLMSGTKTNIYRKWNAATQMRPKDSQFDVVELTKRIVQLNIYSRSCHPKPVWHTLFLWNVERIYFECQWGPNNLRKNKLFWGELFF